MEPPPAAPEELGRIDLFLATHSHTDHLDPGTIALSRRIARTAVRRACGGRRVARERGRPALQLLAADAFAEMSVAASHLPDSLAHEELSIDEAGHHRFLGYISVWGE